MRLGSLEEHPLLISEPSWQSKENRERWTELAFEGYGCPAFYSVDKNVLTSFALGKGTSIVLDVGEDVTSCMPIYDGFVIRKGKQKYCCTSSHSHIREHILTRERCQAYRNHPSAEQS